MFQFHYDKNGTLWKGIQRYIGAGPWYDLGLFAVDIYPKQKQIGIYFWKFSVAIFYGRSRVSAD